MVITKGRIPGTGATGFISYAHDDHVLMREFRKHLKPIERAFEISFWADTRIVPGDYWRGEIEDAIGRASIHVLLATPAFFDSDYICDAELPAIEAKHAAGDLVLPVILRRCMWEAFLGPLQAFPSIGGRVLPVCEWKPQTNGFDASRQQALPAIEKHFGRAAVSSLKWRRK